MLLAGSGRFEITLQRKRAHLSTPSSAINPVVIGAGIVQKMDPLSIPMTFVNMLGFNSGAWKQGTSEQTEIVGCYFTEGEDSYFQLKQSLESIVNTNGSIVFHPFQSPTINTPLETELLFSAAHAIKVRNIQRLNSCKMAAEDFSKYLKHVPGCHFLVGAGESTPSLHTSHCNFPDEILATAAQLMVQIALTG